MASTRSYHVVMKGRRFLGAALCALALASCGREGTWTTFAARTVAAGSTETPTPRPTAKPTKAPRTPGPEPVRAAAVPRTPFPQHPIPSTDLPGGPDGSDETKRDSGVRGQVLSGERPVEDAVVFVKGDGFQSNSTTGGAGRFHVHAPAGTYLVGARADNASVRCTDRTVKVDETSFTTITISCSGGD
jgi:hypothetical protein